VTFTSAPWGLDGARSPASLARLANRAAVKQSGIVNVGDLKVVPLSTPGNGVRINSGGAVLENRYELDVNQSYVVECTSIDTLDSSDNFTGITSQGGAQSHLICITVGDPNYSTAGHAWLTDVNKPVTSGDKLDYQYVRPWVIKNVPAGVTRVEDLTSPPPFPCYAVARIDVPASTTAITAAMIIDLRQVVNARTSIAQSHTAISTPDGLSVTGSYVYETWPDNSDFSVYVPPWATKVYVQGFINGFVQGSDLDVDAPVRVAMRKADNTFVVATQQSVYHAEPAFLPKGQDKVVLLAGPMSIPAAQRGTTCRFSTEASLASTAQNGRIATTTRTSVSITLRFVEEAV
jgi:hypothetical protein